MANTSFKIENGLLVEGNAQFDYTSRFNANVTVAADQWYIGGNLYVTGAQVFIGGNSAVADILPGMAGLKIGNTTYQFDAHLSNVYAYGLLNPVGNTVQFGNSTNRWVISGNTLNISTTSTLTGAVNAISTLGIGGAANALSTLGVNGATTLANTLSVTGAANALSTFGVNGATTLIGAANALSTFGVSGAANTLNTLGIGGAANALSTFGVTGAANALSTLGVNGATTLASTLSVAGAANVLSTFGVTGATTLANTLSVTGAANTLNTLGIGGAANALSTLGVTGATTLANNLSVAGTTMLTGNATLSGTLQTISGNAVFNTSTLFVDATNNRVGIGTTTPDTTLKVQGSFTANGTASFSSTLGVGTLGTTTGVAVNTSYISVGNTTVNTMIYTSEVDVLANSTWFSAISGNAGFLAQQTGSVGGATAYTTTLSANTLTIQQSTVAGNAPANSFIANTNTIKVGNTTSNVNISGNLVSVSNSANLTSTTLTIGATTVNASLINAAAINAVNQTNTATLYVTTSANVGTAFTANSTLVNAIALNVVNQVNTATLFAATSANVGTAFTANSTLVNAIALNVVNQTNTATLYVTTSANVGTALTVNTTAFTVAPNASFDSGTLFVDAVNNRVGINNTAPGVALRVTGAADVSGAMTVGTNMGISGTLGVSGVATLSANLVVDTTTLFVDAVTSRVGIGDSTPVNKLTLDGTGDVTGNFFIGKTAADSGVSSGVELYGSGTIIAARSGSNVLVLNRIDTASTGVVAFQVAGTTQGTISISGTTTTYGAFCGAHWSQLSDNSRPNILRGTVIETIDEMCQWENESNEQLTKFKISDTVASKSVYGVFQTWDNEDFENNDAHIASLGAYIIRIAAGVTVTKGDLLESAGNGCARVQSDDIIRSSTIGKVTNGSHVIETYEDGSYLVPCVLYCG